MPTRAPKACPRCTTTYTGRRCPTCTNRRMQTLTLRATTTISARGNPYLTPQWIEWSRTFRRLHPTCECAACLRLPEWNRPRSQVVDHIDGLGPTGPRGYDPDNIRAMTRAHHQAKTNRHDGGLGNTINRAS